VHALFLFDELRGPPDTPWRVHPIASARRRAAELEIHLIPVLLGDGRRLFEHLGIEQRQLERIRVLEGEAGVTHLRYRVLR
jgi:dihydrofolate reductase